MAAWGTGAYEPWDFQMSVHIPGGFNEFAHNKDKLSTQFLLMFDIYETRHIACSDFNEGRSKVPNASMLPNAAASLTQF
jgi:hypothetical protein